MFRFFGYFSIFCRRILFSQQARATKRTNCYVRSEATNCEGKIQRQKGNALWFILIIVVLFGALSAALSRNTGKVNQAGDIEQARVRATAILRYTTSVETSVQKMMIEGARCWAILGEPP